MFCTVLRCDQPTAFHNHGLGCVARYVGAGLLVFWVIQMTASAQDVSDIAPPPIPFEFAEEADFDARSLPEDVEDNRIDDVKRRLTLGEDANSISVDGDPCLSIAVLNGDLETLKLLLKHGADVDLAPRKASALMYAASLGQTDVARTLLESGADPEIKAASGKTALHFAAIHGHVDLVNLLCDLHADVDAVDGQGNTALILATRNSREETVAALLKHGADRKIQNRSGEVAGVIAERLGNKRLMGLLKEPNRPPAEQEKKVQRISTGKQLADALAAARDGDVFQLSEGTYDAAFSLSKTRVTIRGATQGTTVLRNTGSGQTFVFAMDGGTVTLKDLEFHATDAKQVGVWARDGQLNMERCRFIKPPFIGCYLENAKTKLDHCFFEDSESLCIFAPSGTTVFADQCQFQGGKAAAMQFAGGSTASILGSVFEGFAAGGIQGFSAGPIAIQGSQLEACGRAVEVGQGTQSLLIHSCQLNENEIDVLAHDVLGTVEILSSETLKKEPQGIAFQVQNAASVFIRGNRIQGGSSGIELLGQFENPVTVRRNQIVGTRVGGVHVSAKTHENKNQVVALLSGNTIVSPWGYGILVDSSSPTTLAGNLVVCREKMAVSIQRQSTAVLNGNDWYSPTSSINFYETRPDQSLLVAEHTIGAQNLSIDDTIKSDLTLRLMQQSRDQLASRQGAVYAELLLDHASEPLVNHAEMDSATTELRRHCEQSRATAEQMLAVSLTIEDMGGMRRAAEFAIYPSLSAAAGMSHYLPSDLIDPVAMYEVLSNADSPVGHLSRLVLQDPAHESETRAQPLHQLVLDEVNRLIDEQTLYTEDRFGKLLDPRTQESIKRFDAAQPEQQRKRNRLLLDAVFANHVRRGYRMGEPLQPTSGPQHAKVVPPGDYWIVPRINPNLLHFIRIRDQRDAQVNVGLADAVWLAVQPRKDAAESWDLYSLRSQDEMKKGLASIRPPRDLAYCTRRMEFQLRYDATDGAIQNALEQARKSLPKFLLSANQAQAADPSFSLPDYQHGAGHVRRILSVAGTLDDAKTIADRLGSDRSASATHSWLAVVARIESREGTLDRGILHDIASNRLPRLSVVAATQLRFLGVTRHDQGLRDYLQQPEDIELGRAAAYALLEDEDPATRNAMKAFHNHLLLRQENDPSSWDPESSVPSFLYLLAHGEPSDLRYPSSTRLSAAHLYHLALLTSDPLQPVQPLMDAHQLQYDPRTLGASLRHRPDGDAMQHQLTAMIIRHTQSRRRRFGDVRLIGFQTRQECEIIGTFYRPSVTAVELLGGFRDGSADLTAREDIIPTTQSMVTWFAGREHLKTYVKNWQLGNQTYLPKLDHFEWGEIQDAIEQNGGDSPPALELFREAHHISTSEGVNALERIGDGIDRRAYLLHQPPSLAEPGGLSGIIEFRVRRDGEKTLLGIRLTQAPYYHRATLIDMKTRESYPIHRYVQNDGLGLIDSIHLRGADRVMVLKDPEPRENGFLEYDVEMNSPTSQEGYLDVHLKFFDEAKTLTFPLHVGENARRLRLTSRYESEK